MKLLQNRATEAKITGIRSIYKRQFARGKAEKNSRLLTERFASAKFKI